MTITADLAIAHSMYPIFHYIFAICFGVERWPHTPVSVGSIPAAETVFFYLLTTN